MSSVVKDLNLRISNDLVQGWVDLFFEELLRSKNPTTNLTLVARK
jgi:hypothetical protein